jgi:hypothetical protein
VNEPKFATTSNIIPGKPGESRGAARNPGKIKIFCLPACAGMTQTYFANFVSRNWLGRLIWIVQTRHDSQIDLLPRCDRCSESVLTVSRFDNCETMKCCCRDNGDAIGLETAQDSA